MEGVSELISQVHSDRQLLLPENLLPLRCHGDILIHKPVSFPLRLERVNRWERIASRRRPTFSSHLGSSLIGMWLLPVFRKPFRAGSRKPLNLYGGKWAVQLFRNQVIPESRAVSLATRRISAVSESL
jgi:hypothetical protein